MKIKQTKGKQDKRAEEFTTQNLIGAAEG